MWIRIRAIIIEDEPLASKYLVELPDETWRPDFNGRVLDQGLVRDRGTLLTSRRFCPFLRGLARLCSQSGEPFVPLQAFQG